MPSYSMNHVHHEAADVHATAEWYVKLFDAGQDEPFEKGGATWIRVHIGDTTVTITDRASDGPEVGRFLGYDHLGIESDDFDATMARVEELGVNIWAGPTDGTRSASTAFRARRARSGSAAATTRAALARSAPRVGTHRAASELERLHRRRAVAAAL